MCEDGRDNKYFLINLDTEVGNNGSVTKFGCVKSCAKKRG